MVLDPGQIGAFCGVFRIEKRANGARNGLILPLRETFPDRIRDLLSDKIVDSRLEMKFLLILNFR